MHYSNEAPPEYSVDDPQPKSPKWRWWWRKRVWMPILLAIFLVMFAIIFGAVFGVKQAQLEDTQRDRDRLLAAQRGSSTANWNDYRSSTRPYYGYPSTSTRPYYGITPTNTWSYGVYPTSSTRPYYGPPTSNSFPYPTPGPSEPDGVLRAQGRVPRDISAAAEVPRLLIWDLRGSTLWKKDQDGSWESYSDRRFLFAPVSIKTGDPSNTGDDRQTAVSVDAFSGRIVYMHFHGGQWGDWQELEFAAQFLRRPAVISRAQDRLDVINVDNEGYMWIVSYDGSGWSDWTELGADISSDVSATTWGEDRIDVFAKHGENVIHKHWNQDSGWAADWTDLGDPFEGTYHDPDDWSGSPLAVSWRDGDDGVIDVFMTNIGQRHKVFRNGEWSDWQVVFASHEGYEFPDTQSLVKGRGELSRAHIVSRGTDNCIHYNVHNGTSWGFWDYLWCNDKPVDSGIYYPTEYMATSVLLWESGDIQVTVKDLGGDVLTMVGLTPRDRDRKWSYDDWTNVGQPS